MPTVPIAVQFALFCLVFVMGIVALVLHERHNLWARRLSWMALVLVLVLVAIKP